MPASRVVSNVCLTILDVPFQTRASILQPLSPMRLWLTSGPPSGFGRISACEPAPLRTPACGTTRLNFGTGGFVTGVDVGFAGLCLLQMYL